MPTTRKRKAHSRTIELDDIVLIHLELGDCLLAGPGKGCFCGLRDAEGNERHDLVRVMKLQVKDSHDHK